MRELSGGERRRLQLMRLLMDEPNVLLLDEPTNDLDIDTLTALEDLLDRWPGTLVVVSHDRYFVERVCDDVHALTGDGGIRHLPGGIEQYVQSRRAPAAPAAAAAAAAAEAAAGGRLGRRDARGAQGDPAPGEGDRPGRRARDRAARGDGAQRHRSRAAARAAGRAGGAGRRARAPRGRWLETAGCSRPGRVGVRSGKNCIAEGGLPVRAKRDTWPRSATCSADATPAMTVFRAAAVRSSVEAAPPTRPPEETTHAQAHRIDIRSPSTASSAIHTTTAGRTGTTSTTATPRR